MQPLVDRVRARLADDLQEAVVVLAATLGARPVPGCERGRLVEEEELGVTTRLQQLRAAASFELEPAGNPALDLKAAADHAVRVVQAAAVPVHRPARGIRDQVTERSDAVLQRHGVRAHGVAPQAGRAVRPR